jgi:hypothetical protein
MLREGFHGRDDILFRIRLHQIAERPGLERAPDQNLLIVHREYENFGARFSFPDLAGRFDPI